MYCNDSRAPENTYIRRLLTCTYARLTTGYTQSRTVGNPRQRVRPGRVTCRSPSRYPCHRSAVTLSRERRPRTRPWTSRRASAVTTAAPACPVHSRLLWGAAATLTGITWTLARWARRAYSSSSARRPTEGEFRRCIPVCKSSMLLLLFSSALAVFVFFKIVLVLFAKPVLNSFFFFF